MGLITKMYILYQLKTSGGLQLF